MWITKHNFHYHSTQSSQAQIQLKLMLAWNLNRNSKLKPVQVSNEQNCINFSLKNEKENYNEVIRNGINKLRFIYAVSSS